MSDSDKTSQAGQETPLWQLLDSPTVDVYVGSERTRWPLPERLLSHHSPVLASAFEGDSGNEKSSGGGKPTRKARKSYTLGDEENATFEFLVEYLYSSRLPSPSSEKSIGPLLDLYLLAQRLEMQTLAVVVVDTVREYYHTSNSYPGLRRVQYIYANTDEDNEMREMMVSAVARQLTVGEKIPAHWATALQRNGQLAVDIIRAIQQWHIEEASIPDARDGSEGRGRKAKGGFSAVEREGDSVETDNSMLADSAIGLESRDGDREDVKHSKAADAEGNLAGLRQVAAQAYSISSPSLSLSSLSSSSLSPPPPSPVVKDLPSRLARPPASLHSERRKRGSSSRQRNLATQQEVKVRPSTIVEHDENASPQTGSAEQLMGIVRTVCDRREFVLLCVLWTAYLVAILGQTAKSSWAE